MKIFCFFREEQDYFRLTQICTGSREFLLLSVRSRERKTLWHEIKTSSHKKIFSNHTIFRHDDDDGVLAIDSIKHSTVQIQDEVIE